jgi:uroporphyrin-III C-methyltransferase
LARSKRIPVNCADIPELCDFYFMAQYRSEKLQIAVSTNGGGPRLGARIRNNIVESLDINTPKAVTLIAQIRDKIRAVDAAQNKSVIENRMGWVSRFCDKWSLLELTTLEDPLVVDDVVNAFKNGDAVPNPPKIDSIKSAKIGRLNMDILTSQWYCPKNMGYVNWLRMLYGMVFGVAAQSINLAFFHIKLLVAYPFFFFKPATKHAKNIPKIVVSSPSITEKLVKSALEVSKRELIHSESTKDTPQATSVPNDDKCSDSENISLETVESLEMVEYPNTSNSTSTQSSVTSEEEQPQEIITESSSQTLIDQLTEAATGKIYLCGAGPGNPDMLTLQAYKLLQTVDLVVSDRLIPQEILDLIPTSKLILSSFKVGGKSDKSQDESNENCLKAYYEGKSVLRLKTGDPFVFGRGGEEILYFREHGIEATVIPGLSSVFAGPTSALIPVTHREVADQVLLISGRGKGGSFPLIPEFYAKRTVVVLMSLSRIKELVDLFIEKNHPKTLPCSIIEKGTWKEQRVCVSDLEGIAEKAEMEGIENPAMLVVGEAVTTLLDLP